MTGLRRMVYLKPSRICVDSLSLVKVRTLSQRDDLPFTPGQAHSYRWFIDELAAVARNSVLSRRIQRNGHPVRNADPEGLPLSEGETALRDLFLSLTPAQRRILTALIEQSRQSAAHDLAVFLEDQIESGKVALSIDGAPLAESPYSGYAFDLTCRLAGDDWPELP